MAAHTDFMHEALELARRGIGAVEPNPMVGAVLVRDGRVIGRGWHRRFGGPHAEIEALRDAAAAGESPAGATIYVTLEPCCHFGKTPPCTRALIDAGVARVVAAMVDPFPQVSGGGLAALRDAGIGVVVGVCEAEARRLLDAYLKLRTTGRPWVICKWAQTLDGRIATRTGHSRWISSEASRRRVHEIRGWCDGVAVGANTAVADDPLLTNRSGQGRAPMRVVLDERLLLPAGGQLARTAGQVPLLVATTAEAVETQPGRAAELHDLGAELLVLPAAPAGVDLPALLDELGRRQWTRLLVEGGARVLGQMLRGGLADELLVFLSPLLVGGCEAMGCVNWDEIDTMDQALRLPPPRIEAVDVDLLLQYHLDRQP